MGKKIKVVCLVTNDLTFDQRMNRICKTLVEGGYEVILAGRILPQSTELDSTSYQQKRVKCFFNKGPLFYLEINIRFLALLIKEKPLIMNTVDADTLLAGLFYHWISSVCWIHDAHELFTEVPELEGRKFHKSIWLRLENICLPKVNKLYSVSGSVADYYTSIAEKKVGVIRNLPEQRLSVVVEPESKENSKVILLYQGALNKGRCIEMYIKAMHHIDAELWIAGEGDLSADLRKMAIDESLQHKVCFLGWVKPEALRILTKKAHIGLNVLEEIGLSYVYSLSNKSLDYIQAGVPSINSRFPEYVKLNEEFNVFAFAEPTVESITNSVNFLLNNHNVYDTLRKNCNIAALHLVWTTEKGKLLAIYEETR